MLLTCTYLTWAFRDSSTCTMIPGPPRMIGVVSNAVEHTSQNHWYTTDAVLSSTSTSSATSFTRYWHAYQYIRMSYFCKLRFKVNCSFFSGHQCKSLVVHGQPDIVLITHSVQAGDLQQLGDHSFAMTVTKGLTHGNPKTRTE